MSNCLITKLKGVVDNPNLEVLGELIINCHITSPVTQYSWFRLDPIADITISLEGALFANGSSEKVVNAGSTAEEAFYRTDGINDVKIKISNKYAISVIAIAVGGTISPIKASKIEYCPFAENFNPNGMELPINFDTERATRKILSNSYFNNDVHRVNLQYLEDGGGFDLSWLSGLSFYRILGNGIVKDGVQLPCYAKGDIASLGNCPNLIEYYFWNSFVHGAIETFVAGQRTAGRTEGMITVDNSQGIYANISLGKVAKVNVGPGDGRIKWDSTHIAYYNGGVDDIDDAAVTQIACIGYTDSQIEAWRNAGKTVTKCD